MLHAVSLLIFWCYVCLNFATGSSQTFSVCLSTSSRISGCEMCQNFKLRNTRDPGVKTATYVWFSCDTITVMIAATCQEVYCITTEILSHNSNFVCIFHLDKFVYETNMRCSKPSLSLLVCKNIGQLRCASLHQVPQGNTRCFKGTKDPPVEYAE